MPKIVDHDARRAHVLDRCLDLFSSKGYGSVRMSDIASASGISIGSLYHYFSNREKIGEVLFAHVVAKITDEARGWVIQDSTPEQKRTLLVDFLNLKRDDLRQLLLLGIDHQRLYPDKQHITEGSIQALLQVLIDLMEFDVAHGDRVFAQILGWLIRGVLDPNNPPFDASWIPKERTGIPVS